MKQFLPENQRGFVEEECDNLGNLNFNKYFFQYYIFFKIINF